MARSAWTALVLWAALALAGGPTARAEVAPAAAPPRPVVPLTPEEVGWTAAGPRFEEIRAAFLDASSEVVLVAAHRADVLHAPENSMTGVMNCITMGVDIVEIDLRKTLDGHLVVMHDALLQRTTDGRGLVSKKTLAEIRQLRLKLPDGTVVDERVPTLREVLELTRNMVMVNLDHAYMMMPEAIEVLMETGTLEQAIFKGRVRADLAAKKLGRLRHPPTVYMPIVDARGARCRTNPLQVSVDTIQPYLDILRPDAIEVLIRRDCIPLLEPQQVAAIRAQGARLWVNTLWDHISAGHSDRLALTDPDAAWGWLVDRGITILQTNQPLRLLRYLRARGLHP